MPETVRNEREEFDLRVLEIIRKELCFRDVLEMDTWLQGPRFGTFFQEYAQQWIYPQQEQIREHGGVRAQHPDLRTMEERLIVGERPGSDKFSFPHTNKTDWDHADYLAKLLYEIRRANTKSVHGVFYRKAFTEAEINHRIWILIKCQEYAFDLARDSLQANAAPVPPLGVPPSPDVLSPPRFDASPSPPPKDEVSPHLHDNETDDGGGSNEIEDGEGSNEIEDGGGSNETDDGGGRSGASAAPRT